MLNEHSEHTVHLFEADSRYGGHANTVDFVKPGQQGKDAVSTKVDTFVSSLVVYAEESADSRSVFALLQRVHRVISISLSRRHKPLIPF